MSRLFVAFLFLSSAFAFAAERPAASSVTIQPQILVNGSACLFTLQLSGPADKVTAKWLEHDVAFSPGAGGKWYALAGASYETKPGTYNLAIDAVQHDGQTVHILRPITVHAGAYKTSRLTVPQKFVTPDPEAHNGRATSLCRLRLKCRKATARVARLTVNKRACIAEPIFGRRRELLCMLRTRAKWSWRVSSTMRAIAW